MSKSFPDKNHEILASSSTSSPSPLDQSQQSPRILDFPPQPDHPSVQVSSAAVCSSGSPKEVKGRERQNHGKGPIDQHGGRTLHPEDDAHASFRSSEGHGQPSGTASSSSQASSGHSTGKKAQTISGNHLLNFHYDPIPFSRPQPRAAPPRRQQKKKPYNKDLFLQANYKFVVLDSGNYTAESMDPDKMLCWEDIICLKYSTPFPVQCPICLDEPLCPQITSCGHIFCFPCILQYFSMYGSDLKGECWKKCPLCFTMISSKDLYTIRIDHVKQYHIGDEIEFVLLTRQKYSMTSSVKNNENLNFDGEILDSFSKFTFTSDVELSVREAMSDLDSWIARAESGLVDDIERLPYVSAAMEQLERRKKYWNEHRISNGNKGSPSLYGSPPTANVTDANYGAREFVDGTAMSDKSNWSGKTSSVKVVKEVYPPPVGVFNESLDDHDRIQSSSVDNDKCSQALSNSLKGREHEDSYNFYQAIDGQHVILHPLNMKCLLHHYGSYEKLPNRITGKILQLETITQSEAMRRRYRYLSHFSLTTTFQLCEINLGDILPVESLFPFMDEIKDREKQRKRLARKELKDKIKAETSESQFMPAPYYSYNPPPSFSMDDFEALGTAVGAPSSPGTIGERQSFSSVARLGFAAAYDSPGLKTGEIHTPPKTDPCHGSSSSSASENTAALSFANITSRVKPVEVPQTTKTNEVGKKGKKASRILMSTAGGRRY